MSQFLAWEQDISTSNHLSDLSPITLSFACLCSLDTVHLSDSHSCTHNNWQKLEREIQLLAFLPAHTWTISVKCTIVIVGFWKLYKFQHLTSCQGLQKFTKLKLITFKYFLKAPGNDCQFKIQNQETKLTKLVYFWWNTANQSCEAMNGQDEKNNWKLIVEGNEAQ